ncbi:hypothetical protein ASPCAL12733 [Aspergillus calidoustus]|uniref:F-box domain-containing protein n=1 Tax=Aspergillus calidoustus TaxID=454130 RepID=A0A0U5GFN8_ASPCI|nr:hypothetical protein ASPCAL12733 [Aspergillus calidoustus]
MSLLALPFTVLEAILSLVLDLPLPAGHTLDGGECRTITLWGDITHKAKGAKQFIQAALSLFFASRQLHDVAAPLFYSRTTFAFEDIDCLGVFLDTIGFLNRQSLRYVVIYLERGDPSKDGNGGGGDEDDLTAAFLRKATTTLSSLPTLRGLWVFSPFKEQSLAIDEETGAVHLPLRAALQRFRRIEELVLVGCPHDVSWDILYGGGGSPGTEEKTSSVWPSLSALRLEGSLPSRIGGVSLATALSAANLPSLTHLEFQGLDDGGRGNKQAETTFLVDAIQVVRPLRTFRWLRESEPQSRAISGPPVPQFLTDWHIHTLISRHGDALQDVKIDLAGSLARDYAHSITEASLASVLVSLPVLKRATILAPFLDLVKFFQAIVGSDTKSLSPPSQHALTPLLEALRFTLGSEEDTLNSALSSSKLSSLFLRSKFWNISQLRLRVVVGTRPRITKSVRSQKILRDNEKRYPELEQAFFACMAECRHRSDMRTDSEQGPAEREHWCALSLVDVYDYSPYWDDSRDEWCEEDVCARGLDDDPEARDNGDDISQ